MTPLALDIAVGLLIFLSIVVGYLRGLIKEIFTLGGLFFAAFLSYKGAHLLIPGLNKFFGVPMEGGDDKKGELVLGLMSPELMAKVTAYGGVFVLVFTLTTLLGFLITSWIRSMGIGIIDRVLGGVFGFIRGFLIVFLIYVPCNYLITYEKFPVWAKESKSVSILQNVLDKTKEVFHLNENIKDQDGKVTIELPKVDLEKAMNSAEEELKDAVQKEEAEVQKAPEESAPPVENIPPVEMPPEEMPSETPPSAEPAPDTSAPPPANP
jgi:membrane protein required for colicin V production